jgi:hypothetical protein
MAEYRAYHTEAREKAQRVVDDHDVELGSGTRLVVRLKADSPQAA